MKKPTIELKVNNWSKLTHKEHTKAHKWLHDVADNLKRMGKQVANDFTAEYP